MIIRIFMQKVSCLQKFGKNTVFEIRNLNNHCPKENFLKFKTIIDYKRRIIYLDYSDMLNLEINNFWTEY